MVDRPQTPVDALPQPASDAETPSHFPTQGSSRRTGHLPPVDDPAGAGRVTDLLVRVGRIVGDHAPDLIVGAVAAAVIAAGGWLVAAALTLAVWAMAPPNGGSFAEPVHVAGQLWLAAHHVLLQTPDGPFGLSPLGFTILPAGALVLAGRYAAQRFAAGIWSFGAVVLGYPLASLIIAWSAASGPLHADVGAAVGYPFLIACCGYGAGLLSVRAPSLERWAATAVRAGSAALGVLVCGAALITLIAVSVHFADIMHTGTSIGQGLAGDFGLFLIDLALVPNLMIWALGFASGPGFAVGEGSSVSVGGSVHGALPGLPLVQAVPHAGPLSPWTALVFAIPVAAGAALVLIVGRSLGGLAERAAAVGTALPAVTAVVGACAVLSGGPVAAGSMSNVGPVPWQVALAVSGEVAAVAVLGFGLWYAIGYGRARRAATTAPAAFVPEPDARPDVQPAAAPIVLPRMSAWLTPGQDDGSADQVGVGLPVAGPEGPQDADEERQVEQVAEAVAEIVAEGEPDAEPAPVAPPDDAQAEGPLPEAGPGAALAEQVQDPDERGDQDADGQEPVVEAAADGEAVRVDGAGGAGGVGDDDAEGVSGSGDEQVDDGGAEPSAP